MIMKLKFKINKFLAVVITFVQLCFLTNGFCEEVVIASPAYDFSFKDLFKNKEYLISFLNSLLYPNAGENDFKIREIEYKSEAIVSSKQFKSVYFDINCQCTAYQITKTRSRHSAKQVYKFDVEMQRYAFKDYISRSLFYASKLFTEGVKPGDEYENILPVKVISVIKNESLSLCDDVVYKIAPTVIRTESDGNLILEPMKNPPIECYYIQLDKIQKDKKLKSVFDQWVNFLNVEETGEKVAPDRFIYRISKDQYTNQEVRGAIQFMKDYAENKNINYDEQVRATLTDAAIFRTANKMIKEASKQIAAANKKIAITDEIIAITDKMRKETDENTIKILEAKLTVKRKELAKLQKSSHEPNSSFSHNNSDKNFEHTQIIKRKRTTSEINHTPAKKKRTTQLIWEKESF